MKFIRSCDDLPKQTGPYFVCCKRFSYQSDYFNNDEKSKDRWMERYVWYLQETTLAELIWDKLPSEDVEEAAEDYAIMPAVDDNGFRLDKKRFEAFKSGIIYAINKLTEQ